MGFLKRLFGEKKPKQYEDKNGIYFYVECHKCKNRMRLRADRTRDLNSDFNGGFTWRKTFVCDNCFQQMPTDVTFNGKYQIANQDITGGRYLSAEEFERLNAEEAERKRLEEAAKEDGVEDSAESQSDTQPSSEN